VTSTMQNVNERAFDLVRKAVEAGVVPGAALGVFNLGRPAQMACWGFAQIRPEPIPLDLGMMFDLASLTKVLFTVPEVLRLVEDGLADLDDPVSRFLPELAWLRPTELSARTLRQLLTHTSGLPAFAPLYTWGADAATLKQRLLQEPWPLGENVYSDLGYMLLGLVTERLRGEALQARPLPEGLTFSPNVEHSVATEDCPWRGRVMRGQVHDENAYALGGAAGHAGLFGTLEGVLGAARGLLEGTPVPVNNRALSPAALEELRRPQTPSRALGWVRTSEHWSGGSLCSPTAIGHTGFTGTGVWIDFQRGYAWALLTNNVHPSRHTSSDLQVLRRAVGNALAAAWRPE
jgi:CubicO group peptidase (beta-lactamase class C family)